MQFGFEPQHSTTMCSLVIINHYMSNNSNVYSCLYIALKDKWPGLCGILICQIIFQSTGYLCDL